MKTAAQIIENTYWKTKNRMDDNLILTLTFNDVVRLMNDYHKQEESTCNLKREHIKCSMYKQLPTGCATCGQFKINIK